MGHFFWGTLYKISLKSLVIACGAKSSLGTLKTEFIVGKSCNNQTKPIRSHALHSPQFIEEKNFKFRWKCVLLYACSSKLRMKIGLVDGNCWLTPNCRRAKYQKLKVRHWQKVVATKINWFWPQAQAGQWWSRGRETSGNNPTNKQKQNKLISVAGPPVRGSSGRQTG